MLRAYGTDLGGGRVPADVLAPGSNNAFYSPITRSLRFLSLTAFHPAADSGIIYHEYGHAIFHALQREACQEHDTRGINEGFADYISATSTGSSKVGVHLFRAINDEPRDVANNFTVADMKPTTEEHHHGLVMAGLAWDLERSLGAETARTLVLGAVQLAPRPTRYPQIAIGLVLADLFFFAGKHADAVKSHLSRRGMDL